MHHPIHTALQQLRQGLDPHLDEADVHHLGKQLGHRWRDCLLTPFAILRWFLIQVLHGNTALNHVSLLAHRAFTDAAYSQARSRLPLAVFHAVLRRLTETLKTRTRTDGLWYGHRTFLIDGSGISMPDTPELQAHFGQPTNQQPGCGFPVAKLLARFHAGTGLLLDLAVAPLRSHEMAAVSDVHPNLEPGDVLVGDRGFCSFTHLALLACRGVHAVLRMHQKQIIDFTPGRPHVHPGVQAAVKGRPRSRWLRRLGVDDQVVQWFKPGRRPDWMSPERSASLPATLVVRELRYRIAAAGFRTRVVTLVTTLCDAEAYPLETLAALYGVRWRVELNLRHLKQTMKMDVLKCKTVDGVLKELTIYAMVYNLVRMVICEAAGRQGVEVERVSFVDALRWLCQACPDAALPELAVNPDRPDRVEPRVRKRRPKQFPVMQKPRRVLRNHLMTQTVMA